MDQAGETKMNNIDNADYLRGALDERRLMMKEKTNFEETVRVLENRISQLERKVQELSGKSNQSLSFFQSDWSFPNNSVKEHTSLFGVTKPNTESNTNIFAPKKTNFFDEHVKQYASSFQN